jgi:hypothetical protein
VVLYAIVSSFSSTASPPSVHASTVQVSNEADHRPAPPILFSGSRQPTLAAPWPRWVQRCVTPATADVAPNARVAHVRVALDLVARAARGSRYLVLSCLPPPIRRCGVHMSARRAGHVGTHATSAPRAVADGGFLVPHACACACARRSRWRAPRNRKWKSGYPVSAYSNRGSRRPARRGALGGATTSRLASGFLFYAFPARCPVARGLDSLLPDRGLCVRPQLSFYTAPGFPSP